VSKPCYTYFVSKLNAVALANTFAAIDLVLHPLFHVWGWVLPRSYETFMHEFVIGLNVRVEETFAPAFFVFWILEAVAFWIFGYLVASVYNWFSRA